MRFRFLLSILFSRPLYFLLLPIFFVLHGLAENLFVINFADALLLLLLYLGAAIVCFLLFRLAYKDIAKAAFITFITFAVYFFFGAFHDFLKQFAPAFFVKYSILLSFLLLSYLFLLHFLKRKTPGKRLLVYLNTLFIVLLLIDLITIAGKVVGNKRDDFAIAAKPGMAKPNVYLLVLDEYAGAEQLRKTFHFDNKAFLDSLSAFGFTVADKSSSNFLATPFSMASLLSMSFHNELKNYEYTDQNLNYCYKKIFKSNVVEGFKSLGYQFVNHAIFDFDGESKIIKETFLKSGIELITAQTLWSRVKRDLYLTFLMTHMRSSSLYKSYMTEDLHVNEFLYSQTLQQAGRGASQPTFMYTHLVMPHFPYYFNANGKLNGFDKLGPENISNQKLYLEYLQYVNSKVLPLLKRIVVADEKAVIVLLSDHGFRYAGDGSLAYSNLLAVYDSQNLIKSFGASMTNVNVFRILFNDLFQAGLKLLPDERIQ